MTSSLKENENIDNEWANFISSKYDDISSDNEDDSFEEPDEESISANLSFDFNSDTPKSSEIYISTKTKIAYLNATIQLREIFWNIPVIAYSKPCNGVIKKQMKFNSTSIEELKDIQERLKDVVYYDEHIITSINNPTGRTKFKDIRKISIGISRKDLMSYRSKKKSAFYNCFVLILRLKVENKNYNSSDNSSPNNNPTIFKEYHVKIFNTGKLEIPGIQNEAIFDRILEQIIDILQPYFQEKIGYKDNTTETVLINSNFNCGFFINREALYDILRYKYKIQAIYDPCSYPGIQCKFYYNPDVGVQTGIQISEENKHLYLNMKEVSFMIFRTGSVLIVGKCDENVLFIIYEFLKIVLINEYKNICQQKTLTTSQNIKDKKKKLRKKIIIVEIENP